MLDIAFIRDNQDVIKKAAKKKGIDFDVEELTGIDDLRRIQLTKVEEMRSEQNVASEKIGRVGNEERGELIEKMKGFKEELQKQEDKLKELTEKWRALMLKVPNIPDVSVPDGKSEDENQELKTWGEKPDFQFEPKSHVDLMVENGWADFERGSKVHGFRGYFLKGDGALLSQALWNYARDFYIERGFEFVLPPAIVKKEFFYGTGHLPNDADDLYVTQDDDYLSGTAEVPLMAYHAGEVLNVKELPKKYLAFSPCYRREAGSYGKDTKGLLRVHEFYKVEQLILCEADHERSVLLHEELHRNMEEFVESLEVPYRQVVICTGDLKSSQVKCYDTELWIPSQDTYREIGSASYYHDFQSRRFNIRYQREDNVKAYVHSLNATAAPTPRFLIALIENNQTEEGKVRIPEKLQPYMSGKEYLESSSVRVSVKNGE